MTSKEYRQAVKEQEHFDGRCYLWRDELADLRQDVRERVKAGAEKLAGAGDRATIRRNGGAAVLTSYYTDVCMIDGEGTFRRLWWGFSKTTLKHVNLFRARFGLAPMNKREWIECPLADVVVLW